jgi:cephalosporin-C deacetylase
MTRVHLLRWPLRVPACLVAFITIVAGSLGHGQELLVTPGNGSGLYSDGQGIQWVVKAPGSDDATVSYVLKRGGLTEVARGTAKLSGGQAQIEGQLEQPGWLLAEVSLNENGKSLKALGGALVSPGQIGRGPGRPSDFDSFWQSKLAELKKVPMDAQVTSAPCEKPGVEYFHVTLNNIRGTHIRGQLARPAQGQKFPAMFIVQWAGVYALQKNWVLDRAAEGWLTLNINAHDLPIDEPEKFYQEQSAGPLKDYPSIGNDDRETSYFLRMYLSCFRGAQYLGEREDWDGRTLVVTGGSQGGLQSFVTAALHPKISAVLACVPAGCDLKGPEAGRLPGWPMWYWNTKGKDEAKVRSAADYFDVVNFASLVKCPVLVGVGLIDTVCPPAGVFAAYNLLRGPKEIVVLPQGEHGEKNGSHRAYYQRYEVWKQALLKGEAPPVR